MPIAREDLAASPNILYPLTGRPSFELRVNHRSSEALSPTLVEVAKLLLSAWLPFMVDPKPDDAVVAMGLWLWLR